MDGVSCLFGGNRKFPSKSEPVWGVRVSQEVLRWMLFEICVRLEFLSLRGRAETLGREKAEDLRWASLYTSVWSPEAAHCMHVAIGCCIHLEG